MNNELHVSEDFDSIAAFIRDAERLHSIRIRLEEALRQETRLSLVARVVGSLYTMPVEQLIEMILEPMTADEIRSCARSYGVE